LDWTVSTSGVTGSVTYPIIGNPFNFAIAPNIPLVISTTTQQAINLTFSYFSTGPVCPSIFISDISVIAYICDTSCSTCNFITNACICNSNYQYQGTCQVSCPPLTYTDPVAMQCVALCPNATYSNGGVCTACNAACFVCSDTTNNCTTCASSYYRDTATNYCLFACLNTSYSVYYNLTCYPCDNSCVGCTNTSLNCISCNTNYYRAIRSNTCISNCGNGFYANSLNQCTICPTGCSVCSLIINILTCSQCKNVSGLSYYLSTPECVVNCPSGQFGGANSGNGNNPECMSCTAPCSTCSVLSTNCLSCTATNYLIYGSQSCQATNCPDGQFSFSGQNVCFLCSSNCATCSLNATTCNSCSLGISGLY